MLRENKTLPVYPGNILMKTYHFFWLIPAICLFAPRCGIFFLSSALYAETLQHPNILWLTAEDICPELGCYGDICATTPHIDRLASRGLRYTCCWSNAPVCAPARTTLLTGLYPPSFGAEHMRSDVAFPAFLKTYPQLLREKGYYTTNNAKTDYNITVPLQALWDECGGKAHWRNRKAGQPFFAVFNFTITHESQIRNANTLEPTRRHDPTRIPLPAYHPDTPEVRKDWAQYYDRITQLDDQIQRRLEELDEAGLSEETIIFFYGDNGCGMPRGKRTALDTGLHVPMIVYFPEKYKHLAPREYAAGGTSTRLVSFVDFAPTLLSLVGEKAPETMQGKAFAGPYDSGPQKYIYGFSGRMDERYDFVRSIRNDRYVLAVNFHPHTPYGLNNQYMFQTPTTRIWRRLFDAGTLSPEQAFFFETKTYLALYDLEKDPDQVVNLAYSESHQAVCGALKNALFAKLREIRDLGFLPESMRQQRSLAKTPYEWGHDPEVYAIDALLAAAEAACVPFDRAKTGATEALPNAAAIDAMLHSSDEGIRYWGSMGLLMQLTATAGCDGTRPTAQTTSLLEILRADIERCLVDPQPAVRLPAAEALGRFGNEKDVERSMNLLLDMARHDGTAYFRTLEALGAIDAVAPRATRYLSSVKQLPRAPEGVSKRAGTTHSKILESIEQRMGATTTP